MQVFKKRSALKRCLSFIKEQNKEIGFVPTMGAIHNGHLSLIDTSKKNNDITVVSIFVNPTQFDNKEDLKKYPKTLEKDLTLLKTIGCDIVFIPTVEEIYDNHIDSSSFSFDGLEDQMEGKFRDGHFDGVATVVQKFFEIISPTNSYFGEKDFQQLQIVKKLVQKNNIPVHIVGCPIFREKDGLAMSSRNARLTKEERIAAPFIYETLKKIRKKLSKNTLNETVLFVEDQFAKHPILSLEYITIAEEKTLLTPKKLDAAKKHRAFIAVNAGMIRLIDNISL